MKTFEIDSAIRNDPELVRVVERANDFLERELGIYASSVSAHWELVRDEVGRRIVVLQLSNDDVNTYDVFTPNDLKNESQAALEMARSWARFLKGWSNNLREQILPADNQAERV